MEEFDLDNFFGLIPRIFAPFFFDIFAILIESVDTKTSPIFVFRQFSILFTKIDLLLIFQQKST